MSAFLAALLAVLGPILADLIARLFDKWFPKAESRMRGTTFAADDQTGAALAFADELMEVIPPWRPLKRAVLSRVRKAIARGTPISAAEREDLWDDGKAAERD